MKLLYSLVILGVLAQNSNVEANPSFGRSNIVSSFNTIVKGLGKEAGNVIPTSEELFKASKQVLFGLPETAVFKTISNLCSVYLAADTIKPLVTPDMDTMSLRLRTPCKELSFPLSQAENILESPEFDINKKVAIFITGWMSGSDADYVTDMAEAFAVRGNYNFLAFNSSNSIDTLYTWSAFNTEEIGRQLAKALGKLVKEVPVENIYLIGHSLGAHIAGYAGRYFKHYSGLNLTRITGLDPANPCFNEGEALSGLQRGDAEFIDVIHTNPGVLGKSSSVGDVDFYAEGMAPIQPGCVKFGCSHSRAYQYYTESVYPRNENNFLAVRCTSLTNLNNGFCNGPKYPMGIAVPYNLKGNYFLEVNAKTPYGKNNGGRAAVPSQYGRQCES